MAISSMADRTWLDISEFELNRFLGTLDEQFRLLGDGATITASDKAAVISLIGSINAEGQGEELQKVLPLLLRPLLCKSPAQMAAFERLVPSFAALSSCSRLEDLRRAHVEDESIPQGRETQQSTFAGAEENGEIRRRRILARIIEPILMMAFSMIRLPVITTVLALALLSLGFFHREVIVDVVFPLIGRLAEWLAQQYVESPVASLNPGQVIRWGVAGLVMVLTSAWVFQHASSGHRRFMLALSEHADEDRDNVIALRRHVSTIPPSGGEMLKQAARALSTRQPERTRRIDPDATLKATVERAGEFVPRYRLALRATGYVVLIARRSANDIEHDRVARLFELLRARGLDLQRYSYWPDPRSMWLTPLDIGRPLQRMSLREVRERHWDCRLVIVGDTSDLVDMATLTPRRWTRDLTIWPERALLIPQSSTERGAAEEIVEQTLQVPVGSNSLNSIVQLHRILQLDAVSYPALPSTQVFELGLPDLLYSRAPWLTSQTPPPKSMVIELDRALREYLSAEGLDWLAGCAAFPELTWDNVLYVGHTLRHPLHTQRSIYDETQLERLSRLPWFAAGSMPHWLREFLLDALSQDRRREVGDLLTDLIGLTDVNRNDTLVANLSSDPGLRQWRPLALGTRGRDAATGRLRGRTTVHDRLSVELLIKNMATRVGPLLPTSAIAYLLPPSARMWSFLHLRSLLLFLLGLSLSATIVFEVIPTWPALAVLSALSVMAAATWWSFRPSLVESNERNARPIIDEPKSNRATKGQAPMSGVLIVHSFDATDQAGELAQQVYEKGYRVELWNASMPLGRRPSIGEHTIVIWSKAALQLNSIIGLADQAMNARALTSIRLSDVRPSDLPRPYDAVPSHLISDTERVLAILESSNLEKVSEATRPPISTLGTSANTTLSQSSLPASVKKQLPPPPPMNDWLRWHLDARTGPKRILALDGGGVRSLVTLGILQRIEDTLKVRLDNPETFRLAHYFDLIAGSSTGSIIATALALGMTVEEAKKLYNAVCLAAFKARSHGIFQSVYNPTTIETILKQVLGSEQLQSEKLLTGLMICAKRIDTGSPWVLTNNPRSKYWESADRSHKPNKEYELQMLVRASTAAPLYFEPVEATITEAGGVYQEQKGLFIDGGIGGFNNPSLQALNVAAMPDYGFGWQTGRDNLMIVSVGTGWWRMRRDVNLFNKLWNWQKAIEALAALIQDTVLHNIVAMQAISTPRKPWHINSEIGQMRGQRIAREDILTFQRYDALLEVDNICRVCNVADPSSAKARSLVEGLRQIGNTDPFILKSLHAIGYAVGQVTRPSVDGIEPEDFPAVFDPPFMSQQSVSAIQS